MLAYLQKQEIDGRFTKPCMYLHMHNLFHESQIYLKCAHAGKPHIPPSTCTCNHKRQILILILCVHSDYEFPEAGTMWAPASNKPNQLSPKNATHTKKM